MESSGPTQLSEALFSAFIAGAPALSVSLIVLFLVQLRQVEQARRTNLASVMNTISERWNKVYPVLRSEFFRNFDPNLVTESNVKFAQFAATSEWMRIRRVLSFYEFLGSLVRTRVIEPHYVFSVVAVDEEVWKRFAPMIHHFRHEGGRGDLYIAWEELIALRRKYPNGYEHLPRSFHRRCWRGVLRFFSAAKDGSTANMTGHAGKKVNTINKDKGDGSVFGDLAKLRAKPIESMNDKRSLKEGYRTHALDPIDNQTDPLVSVLPAGLFGENYYSSDRNPPYYERIEGSIEGLFVRRKVLGMLHQVDERLATQGLALWLFDAWRPDEVQRTMYGDWMQKRVRALWPDLDDDKITAEVEKYWAQPSKSPTSPAPHATGGAVDVTLCWRDTKERLWMGSIFDDVTSIAQPDHFERLDASQDFAFSDEEAQRNRRLLHWVMTEAGFCAHPGEWWHFSYGDQMWARLGSHAQAIYGEIVLPGRDR